jgi:hypothetical protein
MSSLNQVSLALNNDEECRTHAGQIVTRERESLLSVLRTNTAIQSDKAAMVATETEAIHQFSKWMAGWEGPNTMNAWWTPSPKTELSQKQLLNIFPNLSKLSPMNMNALTHAMICRHGKHRLHWET